MIELWEIPAEDPLRTHYFKLGHSPNIHDPSSSELFMKAVQLYKQLMAPESHRNFPLRKPKGIRSSIDFLLPQAPFLFNWGKAIAHPNTGLAFRDLKETLDALVDGFFRLSSPKIPCFGYARAIAGIYAGNPGGRPRILEELSANQRKRILEPALTKITDLPENRFLAEWSQKALDLFQASSNR
jgi:hypothetical protein